MSSSIGYALRVAKQYYNPKTYEHALRVAEYVSDNTFIPDEQMDFCISLAIMHDLLEDTTYNYSEFKLGNRFWACLKILTHSKSDNYIDYIKKIKNDSRLFPEAYWVKLADMKDHLAQTETLTDKLRDKYMEALPYLL